MSMFDFFKRKPRLSDSQNALMDKMAIILFGSLDEMRNQLSEVYEMFNHRYTPEQVANALTWMTSRFNSGKDRSAFAIVDEGQMRRLNNPFNREDAIKLYRYVAYKSFRKNMPNVPDAMFEKLYESLGNFETGATTDVIPGAYGEYGLCVTNPIPTRGIPSNEIYLSKLSLLSDEPFHWERIGSYVAVNIEHPIDGYQIITDKGENLCVIYISPYQKIISNKAPKGFYIKKE